MLQLLSIRLRQKLVSLQNTIRRSITLNSTNPIGNQSFQQQQQQQQQHQKHQFYSTVILQKLQKRPLFSSTWIISSTIIGYAYYIEYSNEYQLQQYMKKYGATIPTATGFDLLVKEQEQVQIVNDTNIDSTTKKPYMLPRKYNWDDIYNYWSNRPISSIYRVIQIIYYLGPIGYSYFINFYIPNRNKNNNINNINAKAMDQNDIELQQAIILQNNQQSQEQLQIQNQQQFELQKNNQVQFELQKNQLQLQKQLSIQLRTALTKLGPAFVKAGQQLSIRPDLVSAIVLKELSLLCDSVQPIDDSIALQILYNQLSILHNYTNNNDKKDDTNNVFNPESLFVETPKLVAAASIGQVYQATLKEYPNNVVAIKVQRPNMLQSFSLDLYILQHIGIVLDTIMSLCTKQIPYHKLLYESFAIGSYNELDYINEAYNQIEFYNELLIKRCNPNIIIPTVYLNYTTQYILTTQWIDGIKLADAPKDQLNSLIPIGVDLFLTQLLDIGKFHSDPHPGNLLVTKDGKLCLLDFGLCASVTERERNAMTNAIVHLLTKDFFSLIDTDAKELGFLPYNYDTTELQPLLTKILTVGIIDAQSSNLKNRSRKLMEISNELNEVFFRYPFSVPPFFALVTRGLGLLEGIALTGDPNFDIFKASTPYARRRAMMLLSGGNNSSSAGSNNDTTTSTISTIFNAILRRKTPRTL